jgi:hypothetical protein
VTISETRAALRSIRDGHMMFWTKADELRKLGLCRYDRKQDRYVLTLKGAEMLGKTAKVTR